MRSVHNMGKIVLTNKQKECVKHPPKNNLLVQGIAGSGKSLVLINRAAYLQNKAKELGGNVGIALFTYVNSLVRYTREVADTLGDDTSDINITTIDKQAFSCYRDMFGYTKIEYEFDRNLLDEITNRLAKNDSNRFLKPELRDFLVDEINWIKGRSIASSQEYENCIRYGRGSGKGSIRPSKAERQLIYQIFSRYDSTKKFMSPDDMYEKILANIESIPEKYKYDFVMLDESQDLSLNKLKYAKAVTRKSLTIAGDQNQKIYKSGFTWKEIGIDIKGQSSKKLTGTFRNTYEVAVLANKMLSYNSDREAERDEYVEPELPERHGPKPQLIYETSYGQEAIDICQLIREEFKANPSRTVGILVMTWKERVDITKALKQGGISYGIIDNKSETKVLEPGVKIVTIHSSKGLEFDTVILPYLDDGRFPSNEKNASRDEAEDVLNYARNLLYVAMTRAKSTLYMYTLRGKESLLIEDLDEDLMDVHQH